MGIRLDKVSDREKLKPRNAPYWQRLDRGCMLGFRKLTAQSTGTWMARYSATETNERPKKSLGEFGDLLPTDRFSAAKKAAEAWFEHKGRGGKTEVITLEAACLAYIEHVRREKGESQAADLKARLTRRVLTSKLANVPLFKLTEAKVKAWRSELAATPVIANPHSIKEEQRSHDRSPSSVNRDMSALRAVLELELQAVGSSAKSSPTQRSSPCKPPRTVPFARFPPPLQMQLQHCIEASCSSSARSFTGWRSRKAASANGLLQAAIGAANRADGEGQPPKRCTAPPQAPT